ncbi:HAD-IIIC family phosphatase [Streptomyces sp. NPDC048111]|uniref:HAD-IIIC family phosphatase n=1 Tax=Streptomyces sp. NPDC048111 TaxID=3365500 RepID=UPI0037135703
MTTTTSLDITAPGAGLPAFGAREAGGPATPAAALERLRRLRAEGRLEEAYDTVAGLLARSEATEDPVALRRIGRLLATADRARVRALHPQVPVVGVAVTGQSTVAPVIDSLTAELARHGVLLRPLLGDCGAYVQELTVPGGRFAPGGEDHDLALCLLDAETVFARVPAVWQVADVARAADEALDLIGCLASARAAAGAGPLVLNTVPLPRAYGHQRVDHRSRARLGIVWREFNCGLLRLAESHPGVSVIDLDPLVAEGGPLHDTRLAHYGQARLGAPLLASYAREVAHLIRSLRGLTRKCLVLDLDHTLWDGVLAEDGVAGVAAAGTDRGRAFGAFQRALSQLRSQGVLLAVASKNDRSDALAALSGHPDMALRPEDFVHISADWSPKDRQVAAIAERLGIAPGALVVVDDSPAECGLIRQELPEVAVVRLDDEPALHITKLLRDGWFDCPVLTEDDRARNSRYQADSLRRQSREGAATARDYLVDLDMRVAVGPVAPHERSRVAQLTRRTNRFNLAATRLTDAEVAAAAAGDGGRLLLAVRSADRFGDNGLVGAVLARREGDELELENFWLSCRVLSRGIEQACLAALLGQATEEGCDTVTARYRPTRANAAAADFYPSAGFTPSSRSADGLILRHDLSAVPVIPEHVRVTVHSAGRDSDGS